MFHALQEDSVLNHIAAKIIETLTTTKGPHAEVGISCLTVYLYVSPFFFPFFFFSPLKNKQKNLKLYIHVICHDLVGYKS